MVLSQLKLLDCIKASVPLPINNFSATNIALPVPPCDTLILPDIFAAVKLVIPTPEPTNFVALKVFDAISQLKLVGCITLPEPLPTNSFPGTNVVTPVPPCKTFILPIIFAAVKLVI